MKLNPIYMLILLCSTLAIHCSDTQMDAYMSDQDTLSYYGSDQDTLSYHSDTSDDDEPMPDVNYNALMENSGHEDNNNNSIYTSSEPETESGDNDDYDLFGKQEYKYYLNLIYDLDPETYRHLTQCSFDRGKPCIEKLEPNGFPVVESNNKRADSFVRMRFPSMLDKSLEEQTNILKYLIMLYNIPPVHPLEIQATLLIIKALAPELYAAILEQDPTGEHHIKRFYGHSFAITISKDDGLPVILVGPGALAQPPEQSVAAMAHELSHYTLGHLLSRTPTHPHRPDVNIIYNHAYSRVKEYEADRGQVLDFGIPISDSITSAENMLKETNEPIPSGPQRETFKRTHPFWSYRLEHFKSLAPEVELRKAHNKGRTVFDWKKLADEYVQALKK